MLPGEERSSENQPKSCEHFLMVFEPLDIKNARHKAYLKEHFHIDSHQKQAVARGPVFLKYVSLECF